MVTVRPFHPPLANSLYNEALRYDMQLIIIWESPVNDKTDHFK